jgi:triosephosphate isomerase (TIM)
MVYLVANLKSQLNHSQASDWLEKVVPLPPISSSKLKVVICPTFTQVSIFKDNLESLSAPCTVGAQTVSSHPAGKHTGDVPASALQNLVTHCLVGHSERRSSYQETDRDVSIQSRHLIDHKITPIICFDQSNLDTQIKDLKTQKINPLSCLFAYEPVSAIGTGQPESPDIAENVAMKLVSLVGQPVTILYGGSVSPQNISSFLEKPHLNGVLVGSNSLDPLIFKKLIKLSNEA